MAKARILILEDEAIVARSIALALEQQGYEIIGIAFSGTEAIELAKKERPDLMVMDVRVEGELNGIETSIVIQGQYEEQIPVVFVTAMPSSKFPVLAAVGTFIYVNKPIRDEDLIAAVERALARN